jgi:hypothetical protein
LARLNILKMLSTLSPADSRMPWTNQQLIVFHGCADSALWTPANPNGIGTAPHHHHNINLGLCRPLTDFGRGFYTTTWEHQAKEWANQQVRRLAAHGAASPIATVLRFDLDRNRLAALEDLVFLRETTDFYDLVSYCRSGHPPHNRASASSPPYSASTPPYDAVYGPVSLWQQRLVIKDCDQISFHTQRALAILSAPVVHAQGTPLF